MLSKAVMATWYRPSIRPVKTLLESGVTCRFATRPCLAKKPWSRAAHNGRLKPPPKLITEIGCGGAGGGTCAHPPRVPRAAAARRVRRWKGALVMRASVLRRAWPGNEPDGRLFSVARNAGSGHGAGPGKTRA